MILWKRLKYFRRLKSLGFFRQKKKDFENVQHLNLVLWKNNNFFLSLKTISFGLSNILPILISLNIIKSCFLFIDLKKTNLFFLNNFYRLISYLTAFIIYDWGYGIISNFFSIELEFYTYTANKYPSLAFVLSTLKQQKLICNELNKKNILSIGLISLENSIYLDYPIFIKPSSEYSCVFFQFLLKVIKLNLYVKKKI